MIDRSITQCTHASLLLPRSASKPDAPSIVGFRSSSRRVPRSERGSKISLIFRYTRPNNQRRPLAGVCICLCPCECLSSPPPRYVFVSCRVYAVSPPHMISGKMALATTRTNQHQAAAARAPASISRLLQHARCCCGRVHLAWAMGRWGIGRATAPASSRRSEQQHKGGTTTSTAPGSIHRTTLWAGAAGAAASSLQQQRRAAARHQPTYLKAGRRQLLTYPHSRPPPSDSGGKARAGAHQGGSECGGRAGGSSHARAPGGCGGIRLLVVGARSQLQEAASTEYCSWVALGRRGVGPAP